MTVVVHTPDVVGDRMAGPGIRAWHIAREISKHVPTRLVARSEVRERGSRPVLYDSVGDSQSLEVIEHGSDQAREALRRAEVLIGQPARGFRARRSWQRVVYDLFDPNVLELRELYGSAPSLRQRIHIAAEWWRLSESLLRADLLVCAAARQRHFYEQLQGGDAPWITVPFGIDLADTIGCEKPRDNIVVWGGGTWEWLDPASAVEATLRANQRGVRAKLLFLGRARPNRNLVDRRRDDRFQLLLDQGGVHVATNEDWVPYHERLAWLRAAKIAIMLHRRTAEAEYSIRTRVFDALAAGTPVIASAGGFAADLVEREGLGLVVPPEDTEAVTEAILSLLTDDEIHSTCVKNIERVRPRFAWDVVTRPLVDAIRQWHN